MSKYTVDYFIKMFSKIPKDKWCTDAFYSYDGESVKRCVLGHCGATSKKNTPRSLMLDKLFREYSKRLRLRTRSKFRPMMVNDNFAGMFTKLGKHPRTRIINALKLIKKGKKRK